jgi:hypothetical protein
VREQLDKLLCEGEAHNESGIFQLEHEIYDLEQPPTDTDAILSAAWIG